MQDLRIVSIAEESGTTRLVLSDESGAEYALPVDDALRRAIAPRSGSSASAQGAAPMSPRQIQAKLRAGASVEDLVSASGLAREHVLRYAGPVADERAFFAGRARQTVVARSAATENHRLAFGDAPATLEAMVNVRLRHAGMDPETMRWDAWRTADGSWTVICDFDVASSSTHAQGIGMSPPAEWRFDPPARTVRPINKWAENLTALPDSASAPRHGDRRLAAVDEPFDVDDEARADSPSRTGAPASGADQEDLLDILRARRGQRLGSDDQGDDRLARILTREEQPKQSPSASTLRAVDPEPDDAEDSTVQAGLPGLEDQLQDPERKQRSAETPPADESGTDAWGFSYEETAEQEPAAESPTPEPAPKKPKKSSRRPTMPRWDDILFGSKDD